MSLREILWKPRPDDLTHSNIARFLRDHGIKDARELRQRALDPEWFYPALMTHLGVDWFRPYETLRDASRGLPFTEWFLGGELNIVHNVLDRPIAAGMGPQVAMIAEDDDGAVTVFTYDELSEKVCRFAAGLDRLGAKVGDRVGFYLPMAPEAIIALLGCLKIGLVPVPVFAGFGPEALASRMNDASARFLVTADAGKRRGKRTLLKQQADEAIRSVPTMEHVIVLRRTGDAAPFSAPRDVWWDEMSAASPPRWPTTPLPAQAPSLILYTSGTTGKPKGAVHTHAGILLSSAKEVGYHLDVRPGDRMFWVTDIGWMMAPWEVLGVLFNRGSFVILDGVVDHPASDRLWSMVETHKVTHLGISPTAVRMLIGYGEEPVGAHDLSSLRVLGSTGEPWDESSYLWYHRVVGRGALPIMNISGGTELMGGLLAPLVTEPLKATSLQGSALGMDIDVVDDAGKSLTGEVGYLVCRNASPNMTRGFLNDQERYLDTYFKKFGETVWFHGDWAIRDEDGYWFLTGRADDTLKIAGKRIGPGEVEAVAVAHEAVREAAAVGIHDDLKGTALALVLVAAPGHAVTEELTEILRKHVGTKLGAAMRPSQIHWVSHLPVTRSGKILRGLIRKVLSGEPIKDMASVANPEALEELESHLPSAAGRS